MQARSSSGGAVSETANLPATGVGLVLTAVAFVIYGATSFSFDAGHPDFFYLADAFLHGRVWLDQLFGFYDSVVVGNRVYVPFAPFPAIALMPLVALLGVQRAADWQQLVGSAFAAIDFGLCWWLMGRLGVLSLRQRAVFTILFGFSTPIWWVTTRGGVWHIGHLLAAMLTLAALIEAWGRRRPWLLGLLIGAAFLSRAPLILAFPFFAWVVARGAVSDWMRPGTWPWARWLAYGLGIAPAIGIALWYNAVRFGSPLESGYALASIPDWLATERSLGLFSIAHLGMNVDYLLLHTPRSIPTPPFFRPDGLGMSILLTSPGLLIALRADWRSKFVIALGLTALAVLMPSLLYYGGGWLQFGYRYALDSIPFVMAIVGLAVARRGIGWWGYALVLAGVLVNSFGEWYAYNS